MVRHPRPPALQPGQPGKWIATAEGWARANVLYEKTARPPKAGSLREALFLAVWLKRQEAAAGLARIFAQGLYDVTTAAVTGGKSNISEVFERYVSALFPFHDFKKDAKDDEMKSMMEKQVAKGVLTFRPMAMDFLKKKMKTMTVEDDFAKKLRERAAAREGK